jgi:hypothetical protein
MSQCGSAPEQILSPASAKTADKHQPQSVTLLVHQLVLMSASDYFESKLLRWTTGTSNGKPLLTETCHGEEELWAAQAVLEQMYTGCMPSGVTAQQAFKVRQLNCQFQQLCRGSRPIHTVPSQCKKLARISAVVVAKSHSVSKALLL